MVVSALLMRSDLNHVMALIMLSAVNVIGKHIGLRQVVDLISLSGNHRSILVVQAHPDDSLLCMGSTLIKHLKEGDYVYLLNFSECAGFCDKADTDAAFQMLAELGVFTTCRNSEMKVDEFPILSNRDEVRHTLEGLRDNRTWDVVYLPSNLDTHQDHQVVAEEAIRTFQYSKGLFLFYETPSTWLTMIPNWFNSVTFEEYLLKLQLLAKFKSQKDKPYFNYQVLHAYSIFRSYQRSPSSSLAEGFYLWKSRQ